MASKARSGSAEAASKAGGEGDQQQQAEMDNDQTAQGEGHMQSMWNTDGTQVQQMYQAGGFGFDPSQAGFQGMDWNGTGGFNPMMGMAAGMGGSMMGNNWNGFQGMMGM
jgi:zinc finger CCCH domain-containing protein 13